MNPLPDFLQPLERFRRPFPREAMEAAIARREESIPHLLHAIEWAEANPDGANNADPPYMMHLYAIYLLAQFREPRAYEPLVRLARHPAIDGLLGDTIGEDLDAILAAVCGGDTRLIEELIEDDNMNEWVRGAAVRSLAALMCAHIRSSEDISGYLGRLLRGRLTRNPSFVWDAIVAVCVDLRMAEHLDAIRTAYDEGLADPGVDRFEDVKRIIVSRRGAETADRYEDDYRMIDDAIAAMEKWICFKPDSARNAASRDDDGDPKDAKLVKADWDYQPPEPIVRDVPKIGRNDPCPCGSGKKHKKCCGNLAGKT